MPERFKLSEFIKKFVVKREESLLLEDLKNHDDKLSGFINGSRFLVIGGAGSIGSSYIKAILKFKPKALIVVDANENALAELVRDLRSSFNTVLPEEFICYPFNYASNAFDKLLKREKAFDLVANFAAHKHVRSEKDELSIQAMLENNVLNLFKLLENLKQKPPKIFFSVSTDKAAKPMNVMGASKKLMERVMFSYTDSFKVRSARFANVAFSNGSLPFSFLNRIERGQPLTSPKDVKRYFVSPEESGQLCLLASVVPDSHAITFPKLNPVKDLLRFSEIAEDLLKAKGYTIEYCDSEESAKHKASKMVSNSPYPVYFFESDTSGEKMVEEFFTDEEEVESKQFHNLASIAMSTTMKRAELEELIQNLESSLSKKTIDKAEIINLLQEYLHDFDHLETGKNLDQKM